MKYTALFLFGLAFNLALCFIPESLDKNLTTDNRAETFDMILPKAQTASPDAPYSPQNRPKKP